jgi:very-short-patch-repair endonuclease
VRRRGVRDAADVKQLEVLDWLAFEQSGVLTSDQAVRAIGRGRVRGRIGSGVWRRICRGIVLTHNGRLDRDQQLWAAVLACGPGAVLAGATAAAESGVRGMRPDPLHILVPAGRRASVRLPLMPIDMPGVRVARTTVLPPQHRQVGRPPRTTVARAVVDAAAWARTDDEARTVLASACQQRRVVPDEIRDVLSFFPTIRRRELIRVTAEDIAGGAEALSEIDLVRLCRRFRLPPPELQERRRDAEGRNRYLDAYWRSYRLHAEVDGAHHLDVRHWAADMRRQNEIWIAGDRILRFPAYVVRARPEEVAAQLTAALHAAGWRGTLES